MTVTEAEIEAIVERVVRRVLTEVIGATSGTTRYADARHNPLGSARAYADAARRGDFPTFRRCRRVTALWSDVEAYIERRRRREAPSASAVPSPVELDTILDDMHSRRR